MKGKKVQIILGAVAVVLAAAIVFTTIVIVNSYGTKTVIKKVTTKGEVITEHVDDEFEDFLDDMIGDTTFDDGFWDDLMSDEETSSDEEPEDVVDDMDWIDDESGNEEDKKVYTSKIQKYGDKVTGTNREINIKLNEVAYEDYYGTGGNTFPELLSDDGVVRDYDRVMWEFERHKYIQSKMGYTRNLVNMDAIITNEEENPQRDDIENNKDYQNYIAGKYSWDNDSMASYWEMMDTFKTAGTKVLMNTGWKVHTRIQKWYGSHTQRAHGAAPYDIKSFVRANAYWLVECESRYPGVVVSMCFGNEVTKIGFYETGDFAMQDDYIKYNLVLYSYMQKAVDYIKETGLKASNGKLYNAKNSEGLKNFKLMGADQSFGYNKERLDELQYTLDKAMGEDFVGYAKHYYYYQVNDSGIKANYDLLFDQYCKWNELLSKPVFTHEMRAESPDRDWVEAHYSAEDLANTADGVVDWDLSYASYCILSANTGSKALNKWDYGTYYYPDPLTQGVSGVNDVTGIGVMFGLGKGLRDARVATNYYLVSLYQNYVPHLSDVLKVSWTGEDMRVSAFKLPDGNYTFVVEVKEGDSNRNIKFNFDKALDSGKTLYRYTFNHEHGRGQEDETVTEANKQYNGSDYYLNGAVINHDSSATISADRKSATDTVGTEYAVYVYSTKGDVKNVTLEKVTQDLVLADSRTVDFNASANFDANADIKWAVVASAKQKAVAPTEEQIEQGIDTYIKVKDLADKGSIDQNGLYTAGADAKAGDKVAIVAYIDDNGNGKFDRTSETTYALGVVYIR